MRIPEKVKVGGMTYEVIQSDKAITEQNADGYCDYHAAKLSLKREVSESYKERVFLHEVVHAIQHDLGNYDKCTEKDVDELAGALYALIVDNPEMFSNA